jgi:hypothetical protein
MAGGDRIMRLVQDKEKSGSEVSKKEREFLFGAYHDYLQQRVAAGTFKKCTCRCAAAQSQHAA